MTRGGRRREGGRFRMRTLSRYKVNYEEMDKKSREETQGEKERFWEEKKE